MVTPDLIRLAWQGVVAQYKVRLAFTLDTNALKDRSSDLALPAVGWNEPTPGDVKWAEVLQDTYTLTLHFMEETASDRKALEMSDTFSKMVIIAKHCVRRFFDRYIVASEDVEGVSLDLALVGPILYEKTIDEGTRMITGCTVIMTVANLATVECVDTYFN